MTHHPPSPLRVSKSVSCKLSSFMKKVGGGGGVGTYLRHLSPFSHESLLLPD